MPGDVPSVVTGSDLGLLVAALLLGLRHGVDWDHIAAITDVTASQPTPRRGIWLGTVYALGHASVVFALGFVAIVLGERLPPSVDEVMGRVVGVTLVALGIYVVISIARHGREFRMQSRWMLVMNGARRLNRWLLERIHRGDDPPLADAHDEVPPSYGTGAALTIGALHGAGAETPTQVLLFLAAAGAGGARAGVAVLIAFLAGLFAANSVITVSSASGFLSASRYPRLYLGFGVLTAVMSLGVGLLFLAGRDGALPALF